MTYIINYGNPSYRQQFLSIMYFSAVLTNLNNVGFRKCKTRHVIALSLQKNKTKTQTLNHTKTSIILNDHA